MGSHYGERRIMDGDLAPDVVELVADGAPSWFPDLVGHEVRVVVEKRVEGNRSTLAFVRLEARTEPTRVHHVVVKKAEPGDTIPPDDRPRLGIGPQTVADRHRFEWGGLVAAWGAFGAGQHPGLNAVRPIAHLPEARTLVVSRVNDSTLRQRLTAGSRLGVVRPRPDLLPAVFGLGRWLGAFHQLAPAAEPARSSRHERIEVAEAYERFLGDRHPTAAALARRLIDLEPDLDPTVVLGLGHGDFAPRNAFVGANGDVKVIDILARWRVPIYEDIAFFLTELRMSGPELVLQGRAFPPGHQARLEARFLEGYESEAGTTLDPRILAWYSGLIVVDKWTATVTRTVARGRHRIRFELATRGLGVETERTWAKLQARAS
jgi:hypothetical protein